MNSLLDRIDESLASLRQWYDNGNRFSGVDGKYDFEVGPGIPEAELQAIERQYDVTLPPEYRSFLARFGDTSIGPGIVYRRIHEGLTASSRNPFPLIEPLLGTLSPAHEQIAAQDQRVDYARLLELWDPLAKEDGILAICDYGCAIYGVLILNGPHRDKVWIQSGDTAYYGPFGGSEPLHDESWPPTWTATDQPRDYSFLEWYDNWLSVRLKMAGLAEW